jgi:hypothetical protein
VTVGEGDGARRCLLEYEDAPYSLSRLHRLAMGRRGMGLARAEDGAVLIHRGLRLSAEEREALAWARHDEPIEVLALEQVASYFLTPGSLA